MSFKTRRPGFRTNDSEHCSPTVYSEPLLKEELGFGRLTSKGRPEDEHLRTFCWREGRREKAFLVRVGVPTTPHELSSAMCSSCRRISSSFPTAPSWACGRAGQRGRGPREPQRRVLRAAQPRAEAGIVTHLVPAHRRAG